MIFALILMHNSIKSLPFVSKTYNPIILSFVDKETINIYITYLKK